jgi:endonuclease/exonuclease/phosphatase (EEP) superfamily protein YafD
MREVAPGDARSVLKTRLSDHAPLVADFAVRCGR